MKKEELYRLLENGPVYLDGATGSNLQKAGMPTGVCPEQWILDHPDVILDLQKRYIEAGTQILYAPTFSIQNWCSCAGKQQVRKDWYVVI